MRRLNWLILIVQAILVTGFLVGLRGGWFPIGVPGEWTWSRLPSGVAISAPEVAIGLVTALGFAVFVGIGAASLANRSGRVRESCWVSGLILAATLSQLGLQSAAPWGFGLTKWTFALHSPGSNGYYTVAREQMDDLWQFWAAYPEWIPEQDALHVGTHPPGLFLGWRALLGFYRSQPALAKRVVTILPSPVVAGFREISQFDPLPEADRAAMATVGLLVLLASAATVAPLYLLVRQQFNASTAWASAALWPLIPSAILFQPTADAAFPLLATSAIALALRGRPATLVIAGILLAIGMILTLAFLAIGLVVALILISAPGLSWKQRLTGLVWTGFGFLVPTLIGWAISGANPFVIWWWNSQNHARFYEEYPRTYLLWMMANPIEVAVAIGLPVACWAILGLPRAGRVFWATLAVLVLLQLSGRNLSEVARIWLPFFPLLLTASAAGIERLGNRPATIATTVGLVGIQTLVLQATIQVVYAVS